MAGKKFDLSALLEKHSTTPVRDIETITSEILDYKRVGGEAILAIGQRLTEAKAILPHGEWLPWLTEQVDFSERSAQNFMRLAREWSNPQALADLGASKALSLLALPADERDQFIEMPHEINGEQKTVSEMTSRELEQAIKAQKAAEERAASLESELQAQRQVTADKLGQAAAEVAEKDAAVSRLQKELDELKARPVDVAVMAVDADAIEKAKAEAVAEMQSKLDKAKAVADKAKENQRKAEDALQALEAKLEVASKAEKRESIAADEDLTMFRVVLEGVVDQVNKLHGMLLKVRSKGREADAERLGKALQSLADQVRRAAQ